MQKVCLFLTAEYKICTKILHDNDKKKVNTNLFSPVCPEGFWGPGCAETCTVCENEGVCDKHNGLCNCAPGFMGRFCQNCEYQQCAFLVSISTLNSQPAKEDGSAGE